MKISILAISTAVPSLSYSQDEITHTIIKMLSVNSEKADTIQKLHNHSAIKTRYSVIPDFKKNREEWHFWGAEFPKKIPGMTERNTLYKFEAPKLAGEAAEKALKNWGGDPNEITHVIAVSCTGLIAPGVEFSIMNQLNLKPTVQRLSINFMGCFGAFKALSVAQAFAKENPQHRILIVCIELCSLHFQAEQTLDNMLANSLFSDGAAAVIVGAEPNPEETSFWEICKNGTFALSNTIEKMSWEAGNHGFSIKLSHTVPVLLGRQIHSFVQSMLDEDFLSANCDWAIHPGGKSIIQVVEKALKLEEGSATASWETLANFGNMSSASFLFVLKRLLKQKSNNKWTMGLGFGPGLSVEGILLKRSNIDENF